MLYFILGFYYFLYIIILGLGRLEITVYFLL
uniref:Uncharacterized protein n=1 Tax=Siphoviridae sp. ctWdm1 TaxID=2827883 RepID=A0A8S5RY47_9CAUD|nr:MAG TPA: hypothetical protein [Siphoviridae sp. ctWdm1]